MARTLLLALWVPALFLFAWWLAVYRLKILMFAVGIVLFVVGMLMDIGPECTADWFGRIAVRLAEWLVREIEEHG